MFLAHLPKGIFVLPGTYTVSMGKYEADSYMELVAPQPFKIEALNMASMPSSDKKALYAFEKISELNRAGDGPMHTGLNL